MYCPETVILCNNWFYIERDDGHDYITASRVPFRIKINLLRYQINLRWRGKNIVKLNKNGTLNRKLQNVIYYLKSKINVIEGQ